MIPSAIVAGYLLALLVRWWAVPVVAVLWAIVVAVAVDAHPLAAAALGTANAAVGAASAVAVRRLFGSRLAPRR